MTAAEAGPSAADIWGAAPFERIAEQLAPIHDALLERLDPRAGERLLDVATGTGAVAVRAALAGAEVTAIDIAPVLVETARRIAQEKRLDIRFDVGDAADLPYADGSFDAVASCLGAIFAPDHAAAAAELARVTRPDGRLGLVAWAPNPEWDEVMRDYRPALAGELGSPADWGHEHYVHERLGDAFELSIEPRVHHYQAESGQAAWELTVQSCGPIKTLVERLGEDERARFRDRFVSHQERYRHDGGVRVPAPYLLIHGRRR